MKTTLILGASLGPYKSSRQAIEMLTERSHPVFALGRKSGFVGNVEVWTSIEKIPGNEIHTIGLYLNPENQKEFEDWILELKPERIFFNPGTKNPEFVEKAEAAGIECRVECMLVSMENDLY